MKRVLLSWMAIFVTAGVFSPWALAQSAIGRPWSDEPVLLQMMPVVASGGFVAVDLSLRFDAPQLKELELALPDDWGGETNLYQHWRELRAENARIIATSDASKRKLEFEPGAQITLRWRVLAASTPSTKGSNDYRPMIDRKFFHLIGNAVVPRIVGMWPGTPARFELVGLPEGARFASDLEHGRLGRALNVADLEESISVGGDFRVIDAGGGLRLAIRGDLARSDAEWRAKLQQIGKAQRAYWRASDEPYLVTILPLQPGAPGHVSVGGTGRSDAFAFFATTNAQAAQIDKILAHEYAHTWVPRRIGGLGNRPDAANYWLSEGFTDWVSWRTQVLSGLWDVQAYTSAFNEALRELDQLDVRAAPNSDIQRGFWTHPGLQRLPYLRGMLFAQHLDHRVRVATQSGKNFDHVLWAMQAIAQAKRSDVSNEENAIDFLVQAMKSVAGIDIAGDLKRYIESGEMIALPADLFAPCGSLRSVERAAFHRGFDIDATQKAGMVLQGVVEDGPAFAAGVRNGMRLIKRTEGQIGDPDQTLGYEFQVGNETKVFRYLPLGKARETIRRLELKDGGAACMRRLGSD